MEVAILKNANNKKINTKQIGIIAIIVTILVIIVFFIIVNTYAKIKEEEEKIRNKNDFENIKTGVIEEHYQNGEIIPENDNFFTRLYSGTVKDEEIYEKLFLLVNYTMPNIKNSLNGKTEKEIKEYYNENKEKILTNIGCESQEEFLKFKEIIDQSEKNSFKKAKYEVEKFAEEDEYVTVPIILEYENKTITIKLELSKRNSLNGNVKFKPI